ncbi:hypothetical protein [Comamonas sp.]
MQRGLLSVLENAGLVLALALVVLIAGMGYGFYARQQAPEAAPAQEATAAQ